MEKLVYDTAASLGRIDYLFNNAGIGGGVIRTPILEGGKYGVLK